MPVTQQDIADKVGVSRRAISYALNGDNRVGKEMRERILAVAEELGYQTHLSAKALVTGRTYQVALCVPSLDNPYHAEFIRHFEAYTRHTPYQLLITTLIESNESLSRLNVDGLLMHGFVPCFPPSRPTVMLQSPPHDSELVQGGGYDQVFLNLTQAAREAIAHLLAFQPSRVAMITPGFLDYTREPRSKAYVQGMQAAGLNLETIALEENVPTGKLRSFTHRAVCEYCGERGAPEAFFCINDDIAVGVYRAARELGLRIPEDIAVVGCDDIPETRDMWPPLTTIRHSWDEICRQAWDMLMTRMENPGLAPRRVTCRSKFIIRDSSRKVAGGDI